MMNRRILFPVMLAIGLGAAWPTMAQSGPATFTDAVRQVTSRPVYRHGEFGLEDVSDMCGQALGEMASALYALPLGGAAPATPMASGQ
jgi:hypothetical protein